MLIGDYNLDPKTEPRLRHFTEEVTEILNTGSYQEVVATAEPLVNSPGVEGETRIVVSGATMRLWKYASGAWWYSGLFTKLV